jgi:hypothetical protein
VLVTCYITPRSAAAWPYQREIIRGMPEFELHWEDEDYSEIYRRVTDSPEGAGD